MENVSIEIETNDLHAIQKSFKKWLDLLTWVFFVELLLKTLQFDNVRGFEYNTCILFFDRANTNSSIMFCMKAFEPEVTFCRKIVSSKKWTIIWTETQTYPIFE